MFKKLALILKNKIFKILFLTSIIFTCSFSLSSCSWQDVKSSVFIDATNVEIKEENNIDYKYEISLVININNYSIYDIETIDTTFNLSDDNNNVIEVINYPTIKQYIRRTWQSSIDSIKLHTNEEVSNVTLKEYDFHVRSFYQSYSKWFMAMISLTSVYLICYMIHSLISEIDIKDIKENNIYIYLSTFILAFLVILSDLVIGVIEGFGILEFLLMTSIFVMCFIGVMIIHLIDILIKHYRHTEDIEEDIEE